MARRALRSRWSMLLDAARASLWAIPTLLIAIAIGSAMLTLYLDRSVGWDLAEEWWPLGAGPAGTRDTLSVVAGSVLTVAGVAFSTTIVVLQLASTQYSPRVIRSFRRDRLIQTVFGLYTGTFVFSLVVLRTIASVEDGPAFTAPVSVTVALFLGIGCMVSLVVLVHHVARTVQVSNIIARIADETRGVIGDQYPDMIGEREERETSRPAPHRAEEPWIVRARRDGFLGHVDAEAIAALEGAELVTIAVAPGDYVRDGDELARVWPASARERESNRDLHASFALGEERSMMQDVRLGLRLLADIALRALSPGINDPTTARHCVYALGALLCTVVRRRVPDPLRRAEGGLQVYAPRPSFDDLLGVSFAEIVAAADRSPAVQLAVCGALEALAARDPEGRHRGSLRALAARVVGMSERCAWDPIDRARVRAAAESVAVDASADTGAR